MSGRFSIRLHIDSVVVGGLGELSREALSDAVRAEIASRLAADDNLGDRAVPTRIDRVDGGSFDVAALGNAADVGRGIGAAVANSLKPHGGGAP
jgi:hypothetical protein